MRERRGEREAKRGAVLQVAAELFIEQGFIRTKLTDVAERLNITKAALYNYFASKDDILLACFEIGNRLIDESFSGTQRSGFDGLARVQKFAESYVQMLTQPFGKCIILLDRELDADARGKVKAQKRALDRRLRALIEAGIADGSIRPGDPKLLVFAMMGMLNWVAYWHRPDGDLQPTDIAENMKQNVVQLLGSAH